MNPTDKQPDATAIGVGDGSLGGPAIGGSVAGPDAGVIHDPVGREIAIPVSSDPGPPDIEGEPATDDRAVRDAALERTEPDSAAD